jgi:hypothetical protein
MRKQYLFGTENKEGKVDNFNICLLWNLNEVT